MHRNSIYLSTMKYSTYVWHPSDHLLVGSSHTSDQLGYTLHGGAVPDQRSYPRLVRTAYSYRHKAPRSTISSLSSASLVSRTGSGACTTEDLAQKETYV